MAISLLTLLAQGQKCDSGAGTTFKNCFVLQWFSR